MQSHIYSVEELMLDDSFVNCCLHYDTKRSSHWQTVIRDNPMQAEVFNEAKELIQSLHGGLSKNEVNRQIEIVRRQLQERKTTNEEDCLQPEYDTSLSSNFIVTGNGRIKRRVFRLIAVSAAAACVFFLMIWGFSGVKTTNNLIAKKPAPAMNFKSPLGQRKNVTLPDGSEIILNSNSSVSIDQDFNKESREVKLAGDAFFKVAKNPGKPFVVFANNISTAALGTQFYIHSEQDKGKSIKIDLLEGKVKVAPIEKNESAKSIFLLPGESTETNDGLNLQKKTFDEAYLRNWIKGKISFNNIPVAEAIQKLETWYNVEIKADDGELKNRRISGEYNNVSIQDLLKVVCFSINKRFSVSGNIFIIE